MIFRLPRLGGLVICKWWFQSIGVKPGWHNLAGRSPASGPRTGPLQHSRFGPRGPFWGLKLNFCCRGGAILANHRYSESHHLLQITKPPSLGILKITGVVNFFFHFFTLSEANYNWQSLSITLYLSMKGWLFDHPWPRCFVSSPRDQKETGCSNALQNQFLVMNINR